jgi:hypothetical protein
MPNRKGDYGIPDRKCYQVLQGHNHTHQVWDEMTSIVGAAQESDLNPD